MDIFIGNLVLILGTRYRDEIDDINNRQEKLWRTYVQQMFSDSRAKFGIFVLGC